VDQPKCVKKTLSTRRSYRHVFAKADEYLERNAVYAEGNYYSYRTLNRHIKYICETLKSNDVRAKRIAIVCSDDFWTVATICAVLKYGAAYIPILKESPEERKNYIIKDARPGLILSPDSASDSSPIPSLQIQFENIPEFKDVEIAPSVDHSEACILYTSGSTGTPKGVPMTKAGIDHCFEWLFDYFDFNENDRFLQPFRWTFDISIFSLLAPLSVGACCYLLPQKGVRSLIILDSLIKHRITVVCLVPSIISLTQKYLPSLEGNALRISIFGGEALYIDMAELWKKTFQNATVFNIYGPSETTIFISCYELNKQNSPIESCNNIISLGRVIPNHNFILIDDQKETIQDKMTTGELCINGPQAIPNYINHIHKDRFLEVVREGNKEIFFRTGDLVQLNDNDNLLFIGRNDEQVQIQGHRVELKEIEFHIKKRTGSENAVVVKENKAGEKVLIAYAIKSHWSEKRLRRDLQEHLPPYMIPRQFVLMDVLPRNTNGKVDKKTLKEL